MTNLGDNFENPIYRIKGSARAKLWARVITQPRNSELNVWYAPLYWDRLDSGDGVGDEVLYVQSIRKYPRVLCPVMIVVVVGSRLLRDSGKNGCSLS
ncbi:Protein of unknown function [Pyronema omphalodes CBS 100304]|uniref:Uncharacterized protein n=1 Tax=Pyronema omphalodes (strain CBS 100304) TaxID=1076935 RepID=U4LWA3_PYROM|nr:Protein of unknown function [Pyronema omphalodes CBS 100304]